MLYVLKLSGKNGFLKLLPKSKIIWEGVGKSDKVSLERYFGEIEEKVKVIF